MNGGMTTLDNNPFSNSSLDHRPSISNDKNNKIHAQLYDGGYSTIQTSQQRDHLDPRENGSIELATPEHQHSSSGKKKFDYSEMNLNAVEEMDRGLLEMGQSTQAKRSPVDLEQAENMIKLPPVENTSRSNREGTDEWNNLDQAIK